MTLHRSYFLDRDHRVVEKPTSVPQMPSKIGHNVEKKKEVNVEVLGAVTFCTISSAMLLFQGISTILAFIIFFKKKIEIFNEGKFLRWYWNGYSSNLCYWTEPETSLLSVIKRAEMDPYFRVALDFAYLFPAVIRIFYSVIKIQLAQYNLTLAGKPSPLLFNFFKLLPFISIVQTIAGTVSMITQAKLDDYLYPQLQIIAVDLFLFMSFFYMLVHLLIDWTQTNLNSKSYVQHYRYLVRILCFGVFAASMWEMSNVFEVIDNQLSCSHYADTAKAFIIEYTTLGSLIIFHLSEMFDFPTLQVALCEMSEKPEDDVDSEKNRISRKY